MNLKRQPDGSLSSVRVLDHLCLLWLWWPRLMGQSMIYVTWIPVLSVLSIMRSMSIAFVLCAPITSCELPRVIRKSICPALSNPQKYSLVSIQASCGVWGLCCWSKGQMPCQSDFYWRHNALSHAAEVQFPSASSPRGVFPSSCHYVTSYCRLRATVVVTGHRHLSH